MNNNIPTAAGAFINPGDGTVYKISVDLYTLMMMYAVAALHPGDPNYVINTYNADGSAAPPATVTSKRVMIGTTTTMREWQAIVGWSWAASGHATSNVSAAGYTSSLPYRRVQ
jgi:hypothetical protein